jgi:murein DD-endopeptidase MepM/ murein hydrolase activator NlpD
MTLTPLRLDYLGPLYGPDNPKGPSVGPLVLFWKRLIWRWDPEVFPGPAALFDDVFNLKIERATRVAQRFWNLTPSGQVGKATFERGVKALRERGEFKPVEFAVDNAAMVYYGRAKKQLVRIPPARCFLFPQDVAVRNLGGVAGHMSRPLGNWQSDNAVDFGASPGSPVVSVKAGFVSKGGGYDPHSGPVGTIFGEHTTVEHDDGTAAFYTHLDRLVSVGERVVAGELIGRVGEWPKSVSMDHCHFGARGFNPETVWNWPKIKTYTAD